MGKNNLSHARSSFHYSKNLGSPPWFWLDCQRKFCILLLLKRFIWPYLNVFNQFKSIIADEMLYMHSTWSANIKELVKIIKVRSFEGYQDK